MYVQVTETARFRGAGSLSRRTKRWAIRRAQPTPGAARSTSQGPKCEVADCWRRVPLLPQCRTFDGAYRMAASGQVSDVPGSDLRKTVQPPLLRQGIRNSSNYSSPSRDQLHRQAGKLPQGVAELAPRFADDVDALNPLVASAVMIISASRRASILGRRTNECRRRRQRDPAARRLTSKRSGSSQRRGSRLAEPRNSNTFASCGISPPPMSTVRAVVRKNVWIATPSAAPRRRPAVPAAASRAAPATAPG